MADLYYPVYPWIREEEDDESEATKDLSHRLADRYVCSLFVQTRFYSRA